MRKLLVLGLCLVIVCAFRRYEPLTEYVNGKSKPSERSCGRKRNIFALTIRKDVLNKVREGINILMHAEEHFAGRKKAHTPPCDAQRRKLVDSFTWISHIRVSFNRA